MELLGNKTLKLKDLQKLGLKVPAYYGIPADRLKENPADLAKEIMAKLPCKSYAVRSSALIEDGEESSYAGQFMTRTNVSPEELESALKAVLKHAKKYLNGRLDKFSILVQEFIEADYSGVTFTRNPFGGREMTIEYHAGPGEDLVSGKVKAKQQFKDLPKIEEAIKAFTKIEEFYKFPQDIEWCIRGGEWFFLQVRPITNLSQESYKQSLFLDKNLPKNKDFYFAKTEISEIAPRPDKRTFSLLKKIYAANGPVQKVYKKYGIDYHPQNFLLLLGGELYVDKEKELKTLLPAYSYFKSKDLKPHLAQLKGLFGTLKNIFFLNRLSAKNHDELFLRLKNADSKNFLKDYELIFEINLLTGIAISKLDKFLTNTPLVLSKGLALFPEILKIQIRFDSKNWKGNSLDFSDYSKFEGQLSHKIPDAPELKKWWNSLPAYKRKVLEPHIKHALIFSRLRELGRCLIVKHINSARKTTKHAPKARITPKLPNTLTSFIPPVEESKPIGVSSGTAEGVLTSETDLKTQSGKKILYTKIMSPHLVAHFDKIEGILSEEGALLSHLAIMAREKNIPVVSHFNLKKSEFKLGDRIILNGDTGNIKLST